MKDVPQKTPGSSWIQRCLALCGIAIPVIDVIFTIWLAALNPGYSHMRDFISELGEPGRPLDGLFAAWCIVFGVLLAGFAFGLYRAIGGRAGFVALLLTSAMSIVVGLFPCDPGCEAKNFSGQMHVATGFISMPAMIAAPFCFWATNRTSPHWKSLGPLSLIAGILAAVLTAWGALCYFAGVTPNLAGAVQRALVIVWYVWLEAMAIRLWRFSAPKT